jgi:hypothetical protein
MALILITPPNSTDVVVDDSNLEVISGNDVQAALDSADQAILKEASTGILEGGECTGVGTATLNVASGQGAILDNTDPNNQTYTKITWNATTKTPASGLSYYYVDTDNQVKSTITAPDHDDYRLKIWLCRVNVSGGVIIEIIPIVMPLQQTAAQIWDVFRAYGVVKDGLQVQASGANLKIKHTAGNLHFAGVNFWNDSLNPHETPFTAFDSASGNFKMVTQAGLVDVNVTDLPVGSYDNAGVVTSIPGSSSRASIFSVYKLTNGDVRVLYGQTYYDNLTQAFNASGVYAPTVPTFLSDVGILLGYIIATKGATDLTNTASAKFILTNRFGGIGGGVSTAAEVSWGDITGTLSNQSDLQTAIDTAKMYGLNTQFFGDGSDGDVTISSGTTTLTRDMFYNNLTISGTGILDCARYRVFVKNVLNIENASANSLVPTSVSGNGGNASGATNGSAPAGTGGNTIGGVVTPVAGVTGTTGAGSNGNNATTAGAAFNGGLAGSSWSGGAPALGTGGTGGSSSSNGDNLILRPEINFLRGNTLIGGGCSSASGGAGSGDGANAGGGSGGGSRGGAILGIWAREIKRGASTASGAISSRGGNGGNGGNGVGGNAGGGAGSGGGGGGWVYIVYATLSGSTATNCINVSGGNGGNGGNGAGTGRGGNGGQGGAGGRITLINVTTGVVTENNASVDVLGAAVTSPTTSAGTSGTTGTQVLQNL